jgi:hypothetical protein
MDTIPDSFFHSVEVSGEGRKQASYWEKAFEDAEITMEHEKGDGSFDLNTFIISLKEKMVNESGSAKYPLLLSLFKTVGSLSHGNSAAENGFSINKYMICLHGNSIQPETIEALRLVKDTILSFGSIFDIPISKSLLDSVKLARQRYNLDLENKRRLKEAEERVLQTLTRNKEIDALKEKEQEERGRIKATICRLRKNSQLLTTL